MPEILEKLCIPSISSGHLSPTYPTYTFLSLGFANDWVSSKSAVVQPKFQPNEGYLEALLSSAVAGVSWAPTQKGRVYNLLRLPPSSPSSSPLSNRSLPSSMPCNGEPQDISIKWLVNIKLSKTLTLPSILLCTTHVLLCCWVQTAKFNAWASSSVAHVMLLGVLRSFHPAGCISDVPKLASLERNSSTKLFSVAFLMLLALSPFSTSPFRSAFSSWTIYISYSLLASPIKVRGARNLAHTSGLAHPESPHASTTSPLSHGLGEYLDHTASGRDEDQWYWTWFGILSTGFA
ncbi:hypothetical protein B0H14DRAFT_2561354 [Mycena olivaceomarginata]|nr:hypothetical protein B0H14DRAFT_2561354 [Mycena olivaceomarginata]